MRCFLRHDENDDVWLCWEAADPADPDETWCLGPARPGLRKHLPCDLWPALEAFLRRPAPVAAGRDATDDEWWEAVREGRVRPSEVVAGDD